MTPDTHTLPDPLTSYCTVNSTRCLTTSLTPREGSEFLFLLATPHCDYKAHNLSLLGLHLPIALGITFWSQFHFPASVPHVLPSTPSQVPKGLSTEGQLQFVRYTRPPYSMWPGTQLSYFATSVQNLPFRACLTNYVAMIGNSCPLYPEHHHNPQQSQFQ